MNLSQTWGNFKQNKSSQELARDGINAKLFSCDILKWQSTLHFILFYYNAAFVASIPALQGTVIQFQHRYCDEYTILLAYKSFGEGEVCVAM